jgi:hypothetical protein
MAGGNTTVVLIGLLSHVGLFYSQAMERIHMLDYSILRPWKEFA